MLNFKCGHVIDCTGLLSPTMLGIDAILPRKGPITKAMTRRLQKDWARDTGEGPRVLMSLRVDVGPMDYV